MFSDTFGLRRSAGAASSSSVGKSCDASTTIHMSSDHVEDGHAQGKTVITI
jgi:hypothetical protein